MRFLIWPLLLMLLLLTACASQERQPELNARVNELQAGLTAKHPAAYLHLAEALWEVGEKQEAVVMFYVGQIRYRAYINTLAAAEATVDEQRYDALKSQLGEPLNQFAARNLDRWIQMIDQAINWHKTHPSEFLPKEDYRLLYELTLYEFEQLQEYIASNKDLIRAQRESQGLVNEY